MKRAIFLLSAFLLACGVGITFWPRLSTPAQAQPGCKSFEAIVHAVLVSSAPLKNTDTWGGPLYAMIGGELKIGILSGNDGSEIFRKVIGIGRGGVYTVGFNCTEPVVKGAFYTCADSFTYEVPTAVFPAPPGRNGAMVYFGNTAKIKSGTGIFANASGNLNVRGPAIAWPDEQSPILWSGRWIPELTGSICGIQ